MNTPAPEEAQNIFAQHLFRNPGNPNLFRGTAELELKVMRDLSHLLKISSSNELVGKLISGGSEANILGIWAARNNFVAKKGSLPSTAHIIAPETIHPSIGFKAANMLGLEVQPVPVDDRFVVHADLVEDLVNSATVAIVGVAGNTLSGAIDPLEKIGEVVASEGIHFHVDACFGGFVIPFLDPPHLPDYYFDSCNVSSMSIDAHKMGGVPIPAGGIIFRDKTVVSNILTHYPYFTGEEKDTWSIVGTRSGAPIVTLAHLLESWGYEGYQRHVRYCLDLTLYLREQLHLLGQFEILPHTLNILLVRHTNGPARTEELFNSLVAKGYRPGLVGGYLRFVVMPHFTRSHIEQLVQEIRAL